MVSLNTTADGTPLAGVAAALRCELVRHAPFAKMAPAALDFFLERSQQRRYQPGEVLVDPASGPVREIFYVCEGAVTGVDGLADFAGGALRYHAGDLFPLSAAVARRAVTASYRATVRTVVLVLPSAAMNELAAASPEFIDFINRRVAGFLDMARPALQAAFASQALAEQTLQTPLGQLVRTPPVTCRPDASLRHALQEMERRRIGSMLVVDDAGRPQGIFTHYDLLGRVALAEVPVDTSIGQVMVSPVLCLGAEDTAEQAALLMARHGFRHVPVTRDGVAVGMVSERDLFAMHRMSLKQVSSGIRRAAGLPDLQHSAHEIRRLAATLLALGVQARQLTSLISQLNDLLTRRLVELKSAEHRIDPLRWCWIALGSEGRSEQTVATDQDNALILVDDASPAEREQALAFGRDVNQALDACGYPLCRGGVMAGEPDCCATLASWRDRFAHWIEHGAPEDLLNASIFFDLRPLAGREALALALRAEVMPSAQRTPRFHKQLAINALSHGPPLGWLGGIVTDRDGTIDLKMQGTAFFVDAARLYALAHGVAATGTRERLGAVGQSLGLAPAEYEAWIAAFEFLQMQRLRAQLDGRTREEAPNRIRLDSLNDIDRRMLKECLRSAKALQQRLKLDYER